MNVEVKQEDKCDTSHAKCDISHAKCDINPWDVTDASVYLKYCCPECNYQTKGLTDFGQHALSCHDRSSVLFKCDTSDTKKEVSEASDTSDEEYFDPLELVDTKVNLSNYENSEVITFQSVLLQFKQVGFPT